MSFSSVAEKSFTGIVTNPKEIAPFQIERGMTLVCPIAPILSQIVGLTELVELFGSEPQQVEGGQQLPNLRRVQDCCQCPLIMAVDNSKAHCVNALERLGFVGEQCLYLRPGNAGYGHFPMRAFRVGDLSELNLGSQDEAPDTRGAEQRQNTGIAECRKLRLFETGLLAQFSFERGCWGASTSWPQVGTVAQQPRVLLVHRNERHLSAASQQSALFLAKRERCHEPSGWRLERSPSVTVRPCGGMGPAPRSAARETRVRTAARLCADRRAASCLATAFC